MAKMDEAIHKELYDIKGFLFGSVSPFLQEQATATEDHTEALVNLTSFLKESAKSHEKLLNDINSTLVNVSMSIKDVFKDIKSGGAVTGGKNNQSLKDLGSSLSDITASLPKLFKGLKKGDDKSMEAFNKFLRGMVRAVTQDGKLENPAEIAKLFKAIGEAFTKLGDSVGLLSKGLIKFSIAEKLKAPTAFLEFIKKFFDTGTLAKLNPVKAKLAGDALYTMGRGLLKFSVALALSGPLLLIGIPSLIIGIPVMLTLFGVFTLLGKIAKPAKEAGETMESMSKALLFFSGALILMRFVRKEDLVKSLGVIGVFTVFVAAMTLVSKLGGRRNNAAKSMVAVSFGFAAFTGALMLMRFITPEDIKKGAVVIGLVGLLAIVSKLFGGVKTVLTLMFLSGAMLTFAFTIQMYRTVTWDDVGKAAAVVGGISAIALLLGATTPVAILGAAALVALGGALFLFGLTFKSFVTSLALFKKIDWVKDDTDNLLGVIKGLITGVGEPLRGGGLIKGLTTFVSGMGGTGVLGALGLALLPLTQGLSTFKGLKWDQTDTDQLVTVMSGLINGIKQPIEDIGKSGGFFKRSDFKKGLSSIRGLGKIMTSLAIGVRNMSQLYFEDINGNKIQLGPTHFQAAGDNIRLILTAVKTAIESVGTEAGGEEAGGILATAKSLFLGSTFKRGIRAVTGLGSFMKELAEGVVAMSSLKFKDVDGVTEQFKMAGENIKSILGVVKGVIEEIGSQVTGGDTGGNIFQKMKGLFGKPDFQKGMTAVEDLGSFMTELAQGVVDMSPNKFKSSSGDIVTLNAGAYAAAGENVKKVLDAIKQPIIDIGSSGWLLKKNDFKMGKEAISGIGTEMVALAQSVADMSKISADFDQSQTEKQVKAILFGILNPFKDLDDSYNVKDTAKHVNSVTAGLMKLSDSKDSITKVADAMERIGSSLVDIYNTMRDIDDGKVQMSKKLIDSLVETEKLSVRDFERKLDAAKKFLEATKNAGSGQVLANINNVGGAATPAPAASDETSALKNRIQSLENKMDAMVDAHMQTNTLLQSILSKLSSTLSVETV